MARHRIARSASTPFRAGIWVLSFVVLAAIYGYRAEEAEISQHSRLGRHLLSVSNLTDDDNTILDYPVKAGNGGVVLYILGVLYMFVALAIICDE